MSEKDNKISTSDNKKTWLSLFTPRKHQATEQLSFEEALERLSVTRSQTKMLLNRLNQVRPLRANDSILEIGSGQGVFLISLAELGYKAVGLEPWEQAHAVAAQLAQRQGVEITMHKGAAENIPLPSGQFDAVIASSVIEHVLDATAVFSEVYRVLKPGGIFWFHTASSMCPRQDEIAAFPCFGWYPDRLKRRIMEWAKTHKPHLVGYTQTPAINWFTPGKARRMLGEAGFKKRVYDRWDLRLPSEGSRLHRLAYRILRSSAVTKFLGDVVRPSCSYAAIK